jgi:cytochrome P450/NADPH-cytochrome P450 reductase
VADAVSNGYVQDAVRAASDAVWQALEEGAYIDICGDGRRMAPAVRDAFVELYRDQTGAGEADAQQWLEKLEADERYQQDVFV